MKKRKDCALGIHFDFHARENMTIGDIYSPHLIEKMLDRIKPDFVQIDTKGHPGLSSYPTKLGYAASDMKVDILRLWRKLTAERDIPLYAHHSGLFDMIVAANHPEWAVVNDRGEVSDSYLSVFSPYADEFLIPQIKEIAKEYELNGVWVDGESWGAYIDHSKHAQKAYFEATGKDIPDIDSPEYEDFKEFNRQGFLKYVQHYIEEIQKDYPDFEVTSNWIFSEYMCECNKFTPDFLSGDYDCYDSVNSARHHARVVASHNLTWDLISWGQNTLVIDWKEDNRQNKEPEQIMQEASVVIALGGCFEFFDILYGHGTHMQEWAIEGWGQVADFVRKRTDICFGSQFYHQVGFLFPKSYPDNDRMFDITDKCIETRNSLLMLQDAQYSCEVMFDDNLTMCNDYKVIYLPGAERLSEYAVTKLTEYVNNGGKLIVDLHSAKYFKHIYSFDSDIGSKLIYIDGKGRLAAVEGDCVLIKDGEGAFYDNNYYEAEKFSAYKIVSHGKGAFIFNCFDIAGATWRNFSAPMTSYIRTLFESADFVPKVRIADNEYVDISIMQKDGKLLVNLINMCGKHNDFKVRSFARVPVIADIAVDIDYPTAPNSVYIEPEHKKAEYSYDNGTIHLTVDKLHIHSIIVVE